MFGAQTRPNNLSSFSSDLLEAALLSMLVAGTVFLAQWRYGFNWGDEGWLWYASQRTAVGEVPIRDFFSYDPGRYYWSAAVFKLLGRNGFFEQVLANYLFGAIGLAISYIAMARAGLGRSWRIGILVLLGIVLGFPRHKTYEQVLSLIAAAGIACILAAPERPRRWLMFGMATGLAAFIGRNSGFYFAVAAVLAFVVLKIRGEDFSLVNSSGAFLAGIAVGYSPMLFLIVGVHGFARAFVQSVLFSPNWAWRLPIPFPWHSHASGLHGLDTWQMRAVSWLCLAVPLAYGLIVWSGFRIRLSKARMLALAASLAGIPYLHHAFYHADFFHIAQGTVPLVAAGVFSQDLWTTGRRGWALVCLFGLSVLVLGSWLPMEPLVQHWRTPSQALARIAISGREFEVPAQQAAVMRTVEEAFRNCGAHDGAFLEAPYYPGLYAYLNTRAPFRELYYLYPRDEAFQQKHIEAVQQNRVSLVLLNREAAVDGLEKLKIGNTYPKLVDYVLSHYQRSNTKLPDGFELYYSAQECKVAP